MRLEGCPLDFVFQGSMVSIETRDCSDIARCVADQRSMRKARDAAELNVRQDFATPCMAFCPQSEGKGGLQQRSHLPNVGVCVAGREAGLVDRHCANWVKAAAAGKINAADAKRSRSNRWSRPIPAGPTLRRPVRLHRGHRRSSLGYCSPTQPSGLDQKA